MNVVIVIKMVVFRGTTNQGAPKGKSTSACGYYILKFIVERFYTVTSLDASATIAILARPTMPCIHLAMLCLEN